MNLVENNENKKKKKSLLEMLILCHFNINIFATECEIIFWVLESSAQGLEHISFTKKSNHMT